MAHPIDMYPTPPGGDFLSPDFDNPVREDGITYIGRAERHKYAIFHNQEVTMENGAQYHVVTTEIPERYKQPGSDIANIETTAFLTKPDGFNKRRMYELARLAVPSVFVSVQQNIDRRGRLTRNAHNQLEIAKALSELYGYSDKHAVANGVSRGGMTALAMAAIARQHDMTITYTDSIVPCFPHGLDWKRDPKDFIHFLPNEANSLRAFRDIPLKILLGYTNTVDASPRGLWQQLKEVPTLLGGGVGHQIEQHMEPDTFGYITAYKGDVMSQGTRWQEIFDPEQYPNMIVDLQDGGGHMNCMNDACLGEWRSRSQTISEILHENTANRYLGATALRAMAMERNTVFSPLQAAA